MENLNFDPNLILQMIASGQNPQQLMINYLQGQMQGSPFGENLLNLIQNNKTAEIEQVARNLCAARGLDYDKEFNSFIQKVEGLNKKL